MRHCVASYLGRVERGDCRVYRINEPERCTLALRWNAARGVWSIDQLRAIDNRRGLGVTKDLVRAWLERQDPEPARRSRRPDP